MKLRFSLLLILGVLSSGWLVASTLDVLFNDMSHYKIKDTAKGKVAHRAHLVAHSLSTGQRLEAWMCNQDCDWTSESILNNPQQNSVPWRDDLSAREKMIIGLAGYLHDVGKAGDPAYERFERMVDGIYYTDKRNHELIGCYYILADILDDDALSRTRTLMIEKYQMRTDQLHRYYMHDGLIGINFKNLFYELGLTLDEQKLVAFLVGTHKIFSLLYVEEELLHPFIKNIDAITTDQFMQMLADYMLMVDLHDFYSQKKMIMLIVAVTVADTFSVGFPLGVKCQSMLTDINALDQSFFLSRRPFDDALIYGLAGEPRNEESRRREYCSRVAVIAQKWERKLMELVG